MASTFTSKMGSLTHCISALEWLQLPLDNAVLPPSPSIPPGSPFPSVMQTLLKVLPQPSPHSCISLPGTPPPRQPPQHIFGTTAAQSFLGKEPTASSGSKAGTTTHSWQEGESLSHNHPAISSSPFRCLQARSGQHRLLHLTLAPSCSGFLPSPPCRPLFSWFPQVKLVNITGAFPLSVFICFSREGGVSCSSSESSPSPLIISLKHILLFQANVFVMVFWRVRFQRQEMPKNELYTLPRGGFTQSWAWLATSLYIQGTCSKHLAPAKWGREKT